MKTLEEVKESINSIKKNFNPEKATYRILNDVVTEDYTIEESLEYLLKIKGVEKYPEELKEEFMDIIDSLKMLSNENQKQEEKIIEQDEINTEQEERVIPETKEEKEELTKQQENTRELQNIISLIEQKEKKPRKFEPSIEPENVPESIVENEINPLEDDIELDDSTFTSKLFKIVLLIVILCFIAAVLLVLFY